MSRAERITSAANPLLKDVRRAISRGSLTPQGWWVAETFHLLEEALRVDGAVQAVLAGDSVRTAAEGHLRRRTDVRFAVLPDELVQSVSGTQASQGVIALVAPTAWRPEQLFPAGALVVVLDGLQDPGNAGAIVRAAEAFGATGMLFLKGAASPHHPKTLRASAGSLFRVPFLHGMDSQAALAVLQQHRIQLYAAMPARPDSPARPLADANLAAPCALIIGGEARGIGGHFRSVARPLSIPTAGVESLNASVAAGILLYEARRQRTGRA